MTDVFISLLLTTVANDRSWHPILVSILQDRLRDNKLLRTCDSLDMCQPLVNIGAIEILEYQGKEYIVPTKKMLAIIDNSISATLMGGEDGQG